MSASETDEAEEHDELHVAKMQIDFPRMRSPARRVPQLSPSQTNRELQHQRQTKWSSCCGTSTDSRLLQYSAQLTFGLLVAIFCMVELHISDRCEDVTLYSSILSGIIGVFLPSPRGVHAQGDK